jgi:hypothetical protein
MPDDADLQGMQILHHALNIHVTPYRGRIPILRGFEKGYPGDNL